MSDIKLFKMNNSNELVTELKSHHARLEKDLQNLIEANMETFLGVDFLVTEFIVILKINHI